MELQEQKFPSSFQEAKEKALSNPLDNRINRAKNMMELEKNATAASDNGASAYELDEYINKGRNAISAVYPDIPEYEKAVSAAARFKNNRAADDPQDTIDEMPSFE